MDRSIVSKLAEVGFLAGWELDTVSYCLVMEELGRADSSVRGIVSVNVGLVAKTILKWGTDEQREEWISGWPRGDARLLRADRARRGVGPQQPRDPGRARRGRLDDLGLEDLHHARNLGRSRARLREDRRQDHLFPRPNRFAGLLGPPDQGQARPARAGHRGADAGRSSGSGGERPRRGRRRAEGRAVGARQRPDLARRRLCRDRAGLPRSLRRLCQRPEQFGRPIASFQLVQELLAEIAVETDAARLLTWRAARGRRGRPAHAGIVDREVLRKRSGGPVGERRGPGARRLRYVDEYPVGKYLRDARVTTLYEGTSQIQKLIIGRQLTGESALSDAVIVSAVRTPIGRARKGSSSTRARTTSSRSRSTRR